jgi:cystathionine beta-lyase/cystathionine gamma-synthase
MEQYTYPQSPETICARAGTGTHDGDPLVAPLVQSTTFCRGGVDSGSPHAYSRVSNPTVAALETTLGELENAPPAVCFSSGLAAETALFAALLNAGDHVVCGRAVYGGTARLLQNVLCGFGIETTFVDATQSALVQAALRRDTRLVFIETPANPTLELTDLSAVASAAHQVGALVAVDNTFMTPILQQPLDFGADLSVYSTTKFVEGHSVALGGALVSRDEALLEWLRFIRKSTGGIQTPFNAWLTLNGIKTLPLRIRRQSQTAQHVADWLRQIPDVARVYYPSLDGPAQAALANKQHRGHHGAVVSFELHAGAAAARALLQRVRLCRLVEHVGSVDTLITHPATMTHADVPPEQRAETGISDGLLRLSIGLEDAPAITADLEQALAAARNQPTANVAEGEACATGA